MDIPIFDFLRKQLGLRTDTADPAGSLHAKTVDIKNYLTNSILPVINKSPWVNKSVSLTYGYSHSFVSGDGAYHDIVRISGPRIILGGYVQFLNDDSDITYKLLIDNLTVLDHNPSLNGASSWECRNDSTRNMYAWRLPEGYHRYYDGSAVRNRSFGGTMIVLPPLLPVQTALVAQYKIRSAQSTFVDTMWGIWHVTA